MIILKGHLMAKGKNSRKESGKGIIFFLVVIAAPRIFDLVLKRSTILAMEIFYRPLAYGAYFNFNLLL